ncbi:MAG: signal peptidase II, partial [Candidatus Desulforudis sp.]|nr:signal peptidase II [Desulforudis sp.]
MFKFWAIVLAAFGLDQGTKLLVQRWLDPGQIVEVFEPYLRFTYVLNPGAAFGILGNYQPVLLLASLVAVVLLLGALPWMIKARYIWPAGFLLGGALGNLIDRLRHGRVVDFLDLGFWPVFNIAD